MDAVYARAQTVVGATGMTLIAWAWLRRTVLGWDCDQLVAALPVDWQATAHGFTHAWECTPRTSNAAENWHRILRPHLAVHRTMSAGLLALLGFGHNHPVFTRGVRKGQSPLHLSGMDEAPTNWLIALGYGPSSALSATTPETPHPVVALAA